MQCAVQLYKKLKRSSMLGSKYFSSTEFNCLKHLPMLTGEGDTRGGEAWQAKSMRICLSRTNCDRKVQWSSSEGMSMAVAMLLCCGRRLNIRYKVHKSPKQEQYQIKEHPAHKLQVDKPNSKSQRNINGNCFVILESAVKAWFITEALAGAWLTA